MISLNYRDSRPIYEQIKDGLRKLIVTGALGTGEKLRELAAELKYLGVTGEELAALVSDTPGALRQSGEKGGDQ